jgi:hypothetical protein
MELNIILVSNDVSSIMNRCINFNFCNVLLGSIKVYKYPHTSFFFYCVWIILIASESLFSISPVVINIKTSSFWFVKYFVNNH